MRVDLVWARGRKSWAEDGCRYLRIRDFRVCGLGLRMTNRL
jgi:hypothetical protein